MEELEVSLAKFLVTFLSLSQIHFVILYHRLPTGEENNKPALLKQLVEELEVNLAKSLVTFFSLSDSLPHPVPQAPYR